MMNKNTVNTEKERLKSFDISTKRSIQLTKKKKYKKKVKKGQENCFWTKKWTSQIEGKKI